MEIFENYVSKFDMKDEMILRKYNHTIRVAGLTQLIAKNMDMSDKNIKIANLCGLYHDIGRFMQCKKYHSYDDLNTVDHGDLGYKIFLNQIAPKIEITSKEESIIAKAIMYHNKLKVPSKLTNLQKEFIYLTRDADKIDIFYQMANVKNTIILDDEDVSKDVDKAFIKEEAIDIRFVKSQTDKNVYLLAFIFDIAYKESLKIIKDNSYLVKIRKKLGNEKYDKYFAIIEKHIKEIE